MKNREKDNEEGEADKVVWDFVEHLLSEMPEFVADKLAPSYYEKAREFLKKKADGNTK